jgi:sulfur-oxidizing protein SoxZ
MAIPVLIRTVPARPKAGEVFRVQVLAQHQMETGNRVDETGRPIPATYIELLELYLDDILVARVRPTSGTSANPLCSFKLKAERPGTFVVRYRDLMGDSGEFRQALNLGG